MPGYAYRLGLYFSGINRKDKENIFVPVYGVLGVIDCNVLVNSPILKLIIIDIYIPFTLVSIFFSIYLSIYVLLRWAYVSFDIVIDEWLHYI